MADKLTIDTNIPSARALSPQDQAPEESPELTQLRDEVQARTGSRLGDDMLRAILGHRSAAADTDATLAQTKASYEVEAGQESLTTGGDGGDALRRTIGADSAKGLDQLTQREREQIRSLKSGAVLPPLSPGLEPISGDGAKELSLRLLEPHLDQVSVDGQTYESAPELLEAYQSALSSSGAKKSSSAAAGGRVGLHALQLSSGAPKSGAASGLAMKLGGGKAAPKADAGTGGLERGSVAFADSSWNSLLWSFMERSLSDDQAWRTMMKTVRRADGELKIGFKKLEQSLTELKQANERQQQQMRLSQSGWSMDETRLQKKAEELVGANPDYGGQASNPTGAGDRDGNVEAAGPLTAVDQKLAALGKKATGSSGHGDLADGEVSIRIKGSDRVRRFLTPTELSKLSPAKQKQYAELREERVLYGGLTGDLAAMRLEAIDRGIVADAEAAPMGTDVEVEEVGAARLTGKSRITDPEFARMLEKAEHKVDVSLYSLAQDPRGYANVRNIRSGLMGRIHKQKAEHRDLESRVKEKPEDLELKQEFEDKSRDLAINLDALVTLDEKMLADRPGREESPFQGFVGDLKNSREDQAAKLDDLKAKKQALMVDGKPPAKGDPNAKEFAKIDGELKQAESAVDFLEHLPVVTDYENTIDHLGAGTSLQERIDAFTPLASVGTDLHDCKDGLYLDFRISERSDKITGAYRSLWAAQQFWGSPVQSAQQAGLKQSQAAAGQFGASSKQAHGRLQSQLGKVRNLIDQLIQLTKV